MWWYVEGNAGTPAWGLAQVMLTTYTWAWSGWRSKALNMRVARMQLSVADHLVVQDWWVLRCMTTFLINYLLFKVALTPLRSELIAFHFNGVSLWSRHLEGGGRKIQCSRQALATSQVKSQPEPHESLSLNKESRKEPMPIIGQSNEDTTSKGLLLRHLWAELKEYSRGVSRD